MENFNRQYRLAAGPPGGQGFQIGAAGDGGCAPRINFAVEKGETECPNSARISLWNLGAAQLAALHEPDCIVALRAGYGSMAPLLFAGAAVRVATELDGADRETAIEAVDGRVEIRDAYVSVSYSGRTSSRAVIEAVGAEMGVPVSFSRSAEHHDFPNGFAYAGPGRAALDKACASPGLQWRIQNGVLEVKKKGGSMTQEVFVLSPETGLVRMPRKVLAGPAESGGHEMPGYEVEYLLNGAINVGDLVKLESRTAKGIFWVKSVRMQGDSHGDDWLCAAHLMEAAR